MSSIAGTDAPVLAVDLGGTRLRIAVFDRTGSFAYRFTTATPRDHPAVLAEAMRAALTASPARPESAVVGVPGAVEYDTGEVIALPNLPAWEGQVSAQLLADAVGIPVLLANDADLAALGEHRSGAGRGVSDLVCITAGTGVGAGVIIAGRLLYGRRSLGEVGHMVIDRHTGETVEALGSGTALGRLAGEDPADVTARAATGDASARALLDEVTGSLAAGVLNLAYCFMPERIVIGGGLAQAGDMLLQRVREVLTAAEPAHSVAPEEVRLAAGGDDVGLLGAFALAADTTGARWQPPPLTPATPARAADRP